MSNFTLEYDNPCQTPCTVVISYLSPLGTINSVVFDNVNSNKVSQIKRILNR